MVLVSRPHAAVLSVCLMTVIPATVTADKPSAPAVTRTAKKKIGAPTTVQELIARVRSSVVALKVERKKDVSPPRGLRTLAPPAIAGESAGYFKRPSGFVTGLVVDKKGHILTSFYNVAGELKSVTARVGGMDVKAKLVAVDPIDDLALLKLETVSDATAALLDEPPWADESPSVGGVVFVVGRSPDPTNVTITEGIVSAGARNGNRTLQTDAKLNYGNVGGPVVDLDGRIVGLAGFVGHVHPLWGLNSGIGFASRVEIIQEVLPRLQNGENVTRPDAPFLGVRSDPESEIEGAPIAAVVPDSPAGKAGIQADDVVIEFNGEKVENFLALRRMIFAHRPGDVVPAKLRRGKQILDIRIALGKWPERA